MKQLLAHWEELETARQQLEDNRELAASTDAEIARRWPQEEIPDAGKTRRRSGARSSDRTSAARRKRRPRCHHRNPRRHRRKRSSDLRGRSLPDVQPATRKPPGLKIEDLESSPSELGGLKEVDLQGLGRERVFRKLRYESGVHRVQRVPATEAQGRIHTSTATVAVLPEAEDVDFELKPEDLRIEVCRAGGPGGQGVNTTDSAVQVMHIPTGPIVRCQDGRSQQKNKEKALSIMRARLLEEKQREEEAKYSAHRKSQIGSGGREEKIRTYNFPQNRITDHRIGLTLYNLDRVMEGDLEEMIAALQAADLAERLQAENAAPSAA